jgi:hypothetical protein
LSKIELYSNGIIVKATDKIHANYLGVEGECWSIDEDTEGIEQQEGEYLNNYCSENITLSWTDEKIVDVSCDIDFVNRYINAYLKANIQFEILFCKTNKQVPSYNLDIEKQVTRNLGFIGFDYAYSGGSFYSCVFSDLHSNRVSGLFDIKLNKYGLINSEEELINFIRRREELITKDEEGLFETGEFTIYKLWRYVGEFPINIW